MVDIDPAKMQPKRLKTPISLSLDKENLDYLKDDVEKRAPEGVTISAVFDGILEMVVTNLKKRREKEAQEKKEDVDEKEKI
jgi:hypothetical protein